MRWYTVRTSQGSPRFFKEGWHGSCFLAEVSPLPLGRDCGDDQLAEAKETAMYIGGGVLLLILIILLLIFIF